MSGPATPPSRWVEIPAPQPARRATPHLTRIVVLLAIATGVALTGRGTVAAIIIVVGGSVTALCAVSARVESVVTAAFGAIGTGVGLVLRTVLLGALQILVVAPVALIGWILGVDLLAPGEGGRPTSLWHPLHRPTSAKPTRPFADERAVGAVGSRFRRTAASLVAIGVFVAVAAGAWVVVLRAGEAIDQRIGPAPQAIVACPALADETWAPTLSAEIDLIQGLAGYRPFVDYGVPDFSGQYLNEIDGARRTYEPRDSTHAVEVWVLGGSSAFGAYQRDLHTIPSELARIAEDHGLAIHVQNFGIPAVVNFQEMILLSQRLAEGGRPDLVIFYDGYNDVAEQHNELAAGLVGPSALTGSFTPQFAITLSEHQGFPAREAVPPIEDPDVARDSILSAYRRGVDLARRLGRAYGFEVAHFWQPDVFSKRLVPQEHANIALVGSRDEFDTRVELARAVRARLPEGVVDLSAGLDQMDGPVLCDTVHTDEAGAHVLAEQMFDSLRPTLQALDR